jgi:DNA-binding transcriptional MocR family regulator
VADVLVDFIARASTAGELTRVPVEALAEHCGCHPKTITRHLDRLEKAGRIETEVRTGYRNGSPVRTRWARIAGESVVSILVWPVERPIEPTNHTPIDGRAELRSLPGEVIDPSESLPLAS